MSDKPKTAYELLSDPSKWTKGYYAFDKAGKLVLGHDKSACKWCLVGALQYVYIGSGSRCNLAELDEAKTKVRDVLCKRGYKPAYITNWNDKPERTHEEVLDVLREAGV